METADRRPAFGEGTSERARAGVGLMRETFPCSLLLFVRGTQTWRVAIRLSCRCWESAANRGGGAVSVVCGATWRVQQILEVLGRVVAAAPSGRIDVRWSRGEEAEALRLGSTRSCRSDGQD